MSATDLILWLMYSLDRTLEERIEARDTANAWLANYCRRASCDNKALDDRQLCAPHLIHRHPTQQTDREKFADILRTTNPNHQLPPGWQT